MALISILKIYHKKYVIYDASFRKELTEPRNTAQNINDTEVAPYFEH